MTRRNKSGALNGQLTFVMAPESLRIIRGAYHGIALSLGVGAGLMALLFYSHRKGYDEPPLLPPGS
ncbi:hypothetical protein [Bradyrhizobium valentinum]|uniref:hypothetical protein n=1 Tax=Bradyrhizobium valentinum TaxID=1518501 RepID=UPI0007095098|nr:hypothetical protein [Bradyrhizobium valentinum]KRQ97757.1 hypothetical protein CQ10_28410 [Bradyrhizobium valentinum]